MSFLAIRRDLGRERRVAHGSRLSRRTRSQAAITLWRDCDQLATLIHLESPALFVNQPVMPSTEEDQVLEGRRTAIRPMLDVMRIRPRGRTVTAWKPAALVSGDECAPRGTRDHTAGVVGLAVDDGRDRGVARQPAGGLGRDRLRPLELSRH